jgi:methylmalonyl-CoA/ethylmalonyl-CoA epimerase
VKRISGLAHVGIAVRSIEEAIPPWRDGLGFTHSDTVLLESMHLKIAFLRAGGSELELLEPTAPESTVSKFLAQRGEGVHHLSFYVDDIERALAEAEAAGLALIDRTPRDGSHDTRIAFLHPRGMHGVLVELCERRQR